MSKTALRPVLRPALAGAFLLCALGLTTLTRGASAQSPVPISGQDAATLVKRLIRGFGAAGPLKLQQLGPITHPPDPTPVQWSLVVTDAQSQHYQAYVTPDLGRVTLYRGGEREAFQNRGWTPRATNDPRMERQARLWLAKMETREPTRLASLTVDEKGIGRAYFPILRNGYPFVSHSRYGYDFTFDAATRKFISLHALQNPPPVVPGPPRLDRDAALAALKQIWDTRVTPDAIKNQYAKRVWYDLKGEPELGYYLPKGRKEAGLTWLIHFWRNVATSMGTHGGDSGMLIDAMTGEQIPSDVVP